MYHKCRHRELSDSINHYNIHIIGVPEEEEREKGAEGLFEQIIPENVLNMKKETDIQIQDGTENSHQNQQKQGQHHTYYN